MNPTRTSAEDVEWLRDHLLARHRVLEAFYPVSDVRDVRMSSASGLSGSYQSHSTRYGWSRRAREPEALRLEEAHAVSLCGGRNADVVELH